MPDVAGAPPQVSRDSSAQEYAYQVLRASILSGRFPGGTRLRQEQIADDLKMSRIPVRDAIQRLHGEGLVTVQPNRAVVVTELAPGEVMEIFEIRAVLEGRAVRFATPRVRGEVLIELEDLLRRMDRVTLDIEAWVPRHDAFHAFLDHWSGRPRLVAQIGQLRAAVQPYLRLYVEWRKNQQLHGFEHQAIVAAIASGDARRAEEIVEGHVMRAATKITEFLQNMQHAQTGAQV